MKNKKLQIKCETCGNVFEAYESDHRKYCSKKCSMLKRWETKEKAPKVYLECKQCNKEFEVLKSDYRVKHGSVKYCSKKCSDEAMKKGKMVECKNCRKIFYSTRNSFCSRRCVCEYKKNHSIHKKYMENGYEVRYINGYNKKGNVKEHRYIMEQFLGRKLNQNEIVHHIDGNKLNNDISNLQIMTRGEHSRLHRLNDLESGKKLFEYKYGIELEEV